MLAPSGLGWEQERPLQLQKTRLGPSGIPARSPQAFALIPGLWNPPGASRSSGWTRWWHRGLSGEPRVLPRCPRSPLHSHIPARAPGAKLSCSRELFRSISGILLYQ